MDRVTADAVTSDHFDSHSYVGSRALGEVRHRRRLVNEFL